MHRYSLINVLVLIVAITSSNVLANPVDCTSAQMAVVKKASDEAQKALGAMIKAIESENVEAIDRLARWLGVVNASQAQAVAVRLRSVSTWLSKAVYRCENQTNIKLGDVYAYVDPKLGLTITLRAFSFRSPSTGALSTQMGVLVHEASHFAIAGASKDPRVYGPDEALKLAKSAPVEAQSNAENLVYVVESFYFKLSPQTGVAAEQYLAAVAAEIEAMALAVGAGSDKQQHR